MLACPSPGLASVTYRAAIELWMQGCDIRYAELWNVEIFWWGRIGKILSLLAALTIVVDILGVARLRSFGARLKSLHRTREHLLSLVYVSVYTWQRVYHLGLWDWIGKQIFRGVQLIVGKRRVAGWTQRLQTAIDWDEREVRFERISARVGVLVKITGVIVFVLMWRALFLDVIKPEAPNLWGTIGGLLLTGIGAAVGAAIVTPIIGTLYIPIYYLLGTLLLNASVVVVTVCFITPLAWLLSHPRLEFLTRLANITLFLIGFHFDLLAS